MTAARLKRVGGDSLEPGRLRALRLIDAHTSRRLARGCVINGKRLPATPETILYFQIMRTTTLFPLTLSPPGSVDVWKVTTSTELLSILQQLEQFFVVEVESSARLKRRVVSADKRSDIEAVEREVSVTPQTRRG